MKTFEDYFKESATYYSPDNHAFKKAVEKEKPHAHHLSQFI